MREWEREQEQERERKRKIFKENALMKLWPISNWVIFHIDALPEIDERIQQTEQNANNIEIINKRNKNKEHKSHQNNYQVDGRFSVAKEKRLK